MPLHDAAILAALPDHATSAEAAAAHPHRIYSVEGVNAYSAVEVYRRTYQIAARTELGALRRARVLHSRHYGTRVAGDATFVILKKSGPVR